MNKKQKKILKIGLVIIFLSVIVWIAFGANMLTYFPFWSDNEKFFNAAKGKFESGFIWGLDLTFMISGMTAIICGYLISKNKKDKKDDI